MTSSRKYRTSCGRRWSKRPVQYRSTRVEAASTIPIDPAVKAEHSNLIQLGQDSQLLARIAAKIGQPDQAGPGAEVRELTDKETQEIDSMLKKMIAQIETMAEAKNVPLTDYEILDFLENYFAGLAG